ncbi:MAG: OmpH family outer membrane protein [Candidatus Omnitrophica bacterium]|nr:OmpH family outer membrane protein [Candidatus Omnitrophota bacterium]
MKKCIIFLVALAVTCSFSQISFAKDLKIGYLNFLEVFNEYNKTKDYDEVLNKKAEAKEKELKVKESEIEKMQSKLNVLKDKEKAKEEKNFQKVAQDFIQLKRQSLIDLKKEKDEKMKEIIEDIDKAIKDYAKKNNFDLVVHGSAVLYGDNAMDITKDILKIVNSTAKK